MPSPNEDYGKVVLSIDESGAMTWTLAREESRTVDTTTRGGELRTYLVPRTVAPTPEGEATTRSLGGAIGKKLLKVLVFPLIDPVIGKIGEDFASKWGAKKRPYSLRTFTPDDYNQEAGTPITPERLRQMSGGRALLFLHRTFSRAFSAFGALSKSTVEKLHEIYQGRVFAFDHFTMSEDPIENVRWFVNHLPENVYLDFDIICHSRGGLVSRTLDVGKIVFVAAPNAGTTLADSKYMGIPASKPGPPIACSTASFKRPRMTSSSPCFPIAEKLVYGQGDGISHTTYFGERRTQEKILGWLGEGEGWPTSLWTGGP